MNNELKPLVSIVGPTAVGKTKTSIELAGTFTGEVINGDAFQFYRGLDIGTAKVAEAEKQGIPHHMIDILPPEADYSVQEFQQEARHAVSEVHARGHLPILTGGSGFYVRALTYDVHFSAAPQDPDLRKELEQFAENEGAEALYRRLQEKDPERAGNLHPNNVKRVIRALEIVELTGRSSVQDGIGEELPVYKNIFIGLSMARTQLYERINKRVDIMIENGLIQEARTLFDQGAAASQAGQAIGYKELFACFKGEISLDEAVRLIKKASRHFAKRQLTYFRRQLPVKWFDMTGGAGVFEEKISEIKKYVAGNLA